MPLTLRPINVITREIIKDWKNISPAAKPYLEAMLQLKTVNDQYVYENSDGIICYFLSNAAGWKGEVARRIKHELKQLIS